LEYWTTEICELWLTHRPFVPPFHPFHPLLLKEMRFPLALFALVQFLASTKSSVNANMSVSPTSKKVETPAITSKKVETEFGHPQLNNFLIDPSYLNLNHGSFGTTPLYVLEKQHQYILQQEARPDIWFRDTYKTLIQEARSRVAKLVNASADNIVLLENASAAVNSIMRSIELKEGDIFIHLSTAYNMVKNTAKFQRFDRGIEVIEVAIDFPMTDGASAFVEPLAAVLSSMDADRRSRVRLVSLSHIASVPAILLPIKELTTLIKANNPNSLVLIDGAHSIGQIEVDIQELGDIDYYLSNFHKWLFAPKGSCFLWVNERNIGEVRPQPTVISSANDVDSGVSFIDRWEVSACLLTFLFYSQARFKYLRISHPLSLSLFPPLFFVIRLFLTVHGN
jgi:hypothetical protein